MASEITPPTTTSPKINNNFSSSNSTSSVSSRKVSRRSKDEVRSRFLNNLGMFNAPSGAVIDNTPSPAIARKINILRAMGLGGVISGGPPSSSIAANATPLCQDNEVIEIRPKLSQVPIVSEPLKYKKDNNTTTSTTTAPPVVSKDATSEGETQQPNNNNNKPQKQRISFSDSVAVVPIPMRSEYSDRVRSRLWSNRYEIHENATRNAIEFAAEGWDWRSVTEDEGMFVCTASGELIHPVHCQQ